MSTARATCLTRRPGCDKVTDGSGRVRAAHPSPTHHRRVTIGDFSEPSSLAPPHSPSPQPALTSINAPRHLYEVAGRRRTAPEKSPIVTPVRRSDRPTPIWRHPSARQPGSLARMSAPLHADVSQHICGIRTLTGQSNLRQPPASPRDHTPRPNSAPQVTLDLWTIRSLPDRR